MKVSVSRAFHKSLSFLLFGRRKQYEENLLKPYRDGNKFYEILNTYEIYNQKPSYY